MKSIINYAVVALSTLGLTSAVAVAVAAPAAPSSTAVCSVKPLLNGNFNSGSLSPWSPSIEGGSTSSVSISRKAQQGKYAANFTLGWNKSDAKGPHGQEGGAPLIDLTQRVNYCSETQNLTFFYNIQPHPAHDNELNVFIYDSITHHVYANTVVHYKAGSTKDSKGNAYGQYHELGDFIFATSNNDLIFSIVVSGSYYKTTGTSTVLIDSIAVGQAVL